MSMMDIASMSRQVALPGSVPISAVNSKVPMFLQKLYKIVDEPSTNDVICWAEDGNSFFVLDHERLAREHLGNWFKHNKFPSFVRQLNMYGFHKIPHLQQGVLKSESTTEQWQFAHEHFHRGQEDRLIFIERKKQKDHSQAAFTAATPAAGPTSLPSNQVIDMHSIINGIAAIRRHQTAISQELNDLKRSNQALWRESMEARARHSHQQDTINRIVKFLAGIFGNHVGPMGSPDPNVDNRTPPSHGMQVPVPRLMIEDRQRPNNKVQVTEVEDDSEMSSFINEPTPSVSSTVNATTGGSTSPAMTDASTSSHEFEFPPVTTANTTPPSTLASPNDILPAQPQYPSNTDEHSPAFVSPPQSPKNVDSTIQAALSQLSSADLQQLISALANQPYDPSPSNLPNPANVPAPYLDFGSASPSIPPSNVPLLDLNPANNSELISFDTPYKLDKQWQATEDIDKDVGTLDTGINSLMETLGLDPNFLESDENNPQAYMNNDQTNHFYNTFLESFPSGPEEESTAFMDNIPTPTGDGTTPVSAPSPEVRATGQKRKSDTSSLYGGNNVKDSQINTRSKRRKDR